MLSARFCRTVPTHIAVVEYTREPRAALILRSGRSPRLEEWGGLMHPDRAGPRPSRRSPGSRFAQPVSLLRTRASNHAPQHVGGNSAFAVAHAQKVAARTKGNAILSLRHTAMSSCEPQRRSGWATAKPLPTLQERLPHAARARALRRCVGGRRGARAAGGRAHDLPRARRRDDRGARAARRRSLARRRRGNGPRERHRRDLLAFRLCFAARWHSCRRKLAAKTCRAPRHVAPGR